MGEAKVKMGAGRVKEPSTIGRSKAGGSRGEGGPEQASRAS